MEGVWEEKEWHLRWCDLMGLDPLEVYTRTWEPEAWENELLTGKFKLEYPYISGNAPLHAQTIMGKTYGTVFLTMFPSVGYAVHNNQRFRRKTHG